MGCDIHIFLEKYNERTEHWQSFDFWEKNEYYNPNPQTDDEKEEAEWEREYVVVEFDDDRWYEKFSILSDGVRGEAEGPYAPDNGFPKNASKDTAENFKRWDCDAHSPNHITVAEFRPLASKYRLLKGNESPLAEMSKNLEEHIKRKLKWDHIIEKQNWEHIRMVYWFDN